MEYDYIDIAQIDKKYKHGNGLTIEADGEAFHVQLENQKTGFGSRKFFICPECGRRRMRLYRQKGTLFQCDKCSGINPYKAIQNGTRGGYIEIQYRMKNYAKKYKIAFDFPFDYLQFTNDPRLKGKKFLKALTVLQALENIRAQNIFFKTVYKPKVIKSVLNGKHPLLSEKSLFELKKWMFRF